MTKILVVDDNVDAAITLAMLLEAVGHSVQVAHSGAEALRMSASFQPHITFLDIDMPVMDGCAVAEHLRAQEPAVSVFLLALTALSEAGVKERCGKAGFDFFFRKPVDFSVLLAIVDELAKRKPVLGARIMI